jgi:hypothetical protein
VFIVTLHTPIATNKIRKIALDPIKDQYNRTWRLVDLPGEQIEVLRQWALVNREGTDIRLIPVAIVLALVGIFAEGILISGDGETSYLCLAIRWWWSGIMTSPFRLRYFLSLLVSWVIFGVIKLLENSFGNIVVQSLLIEACIVAEYVQDAVEMEENLSNYDYRSFETAFGFFWRH